MILFPAIDLNDGRCVRLVQGDMEQATVFGDDPAAQAASFEAQGFEWLHVVDLDGAFAGKPMNANAVDAILRRYGVDSMRVSEAGIREGTILAREHAGVAYKTVRAELEAYGNGLDEKPEIVALSKIDALSPELLKQQKDRLRRASKQPLLLLSSWTTPTCTSRTTSE